MIEKFTVEEVNLMGIFDTSSKDTLAAELTEAITKFFDSELNEIADNTLVKLLRMSDDEFSAFELCPVYDDYNENNQESEVQPNGD